MGSTLLRITVTGHGYLLHMVQMAPELDICDCPSREDLWVREGKILNPEKLFFDEKGSADVQLDCKDSIIAPGFIDVQINGTVTLHALADWEHPGFVHPQFPAPLRVSCPWPHFSCSREV